MNNPLQTGTATARFVATHSVLTLDARHPYVAKSLIDAQDMHRTVMSGFQGWVDDGSRDARAQLGVLSTWTLDLKEAVLVLVVQSKVAADWGNVPNAALRDVPQLITVDHTFRAGDTVVFRSVVNPTYSKPRTGPDGQMIRGQRVAHTKPDGVRKWCSRLFGTGDIPGRIGAAAEPDAISVRMLPAVSSPATHKGLKVARAELRGSLTVTDPKAFVTALSDGIGHARAYGCGLILTR
ncbi:MULTISPECIES: type I-E CRISPR-associated protein Cas6/Cse3/CasE [unclassified Streptomyces]|uniref:type I-E CRISPR-associated protein Cas6/Cse3/CasE n=1 Tax=unclassified Streptomyces TaxID=2593676 RepID=UPI002E80D000|nr:type I-E CRISPR-associated protein Cas6/Cse3/CasE [Streptomyces sp. NBC_00589]WTI42338.1 type I-E CRISPR-associated protein Cas6/Cse3/CasE [Streptomyces sp. NBC_00775]WUB23980.1 type I-E CRISPR-associated protein Cas6/Cse3/CasE [Streptomyces sp. NBC_00589]